MPFGKASLGAGKVVAEDQFGMSDFNHRGLMVEFNLATDADFPFCWRLYRDLMQLPLRSAAGGGERQSRTEFRNTFLCNHALVLMIDGRRAGWLELEEDDTAIHMHQLHLSAPFQGQGIGSNVIDQITVIAAEKSKAVRLEVLKKNTGAIRLYKRLGFRVMRADTQKYFMSKCKPD